MVTVTEQLSNEGDNLLEFGIFFSEEPVSLARHIKESVPRALLVGCAVSNVTARCNIDALSWFILRQVEHRTLADFIHCLRSL